MRRLNGLLTLMALLLASGCATLPSGPSVMVVPGPGKPFDLYQAEDETCRQWAGQRIGMTPEEIYSQTTASGAVVGTLIGAGIGTALGAAAGNPGAGAAIGAGSGLFLGAASGSDYGRVYGREAQRRYDIAYLQCMYANGNRLPTAGRRYSRPVTVPPDYDDEPALYAPTYRPPPPNQPPPRLSPSVKPSSPAPSGTESAPYPAD